MSFTLILVFGAGQGLGIFGFVPCPERIGAQDGPIRVAALVNGNQGQVFRLHHVVATRHVLGFVGGVRRDWTALAKQVQRELYQRLFTDQPVEVYLADIVRTVREGAFDDLLVYRKNLRKGAEDYTATTPPHVAAARKSAPAAASARRKSIEYVVTTAGPEPLDNIQHPLDREHYITKQVKPVAEPVLATLGLDFDVVIGDGRQVEMPF